MRSGKWKHFYGWPRATVNIATPLQYGMRRTGFNLCEALGQSTCEAPSPIVVRKKMESGNQFAKSRKWRSENTAIKYSKSLLECPRSLRLLLPSTQKHQIARNCWNPTWLVGTGLLTDTGKPTEIATTEIFDKTHGLRFFIRITSVFLICVQRKQSHCTYSICGGIKTLKHHVAACLPRL